MFKLYGKNKTAAPSMEQVSAGDTAVINGEEHWDTFKVQAVMVGIFTLLAVMLVTKIIEMNKKSRKPRTFDASDDEYVLELCTSLPTMPLPSKPKALPKGVDFLGVTEFNVLQAIVDTFLPGYTAADEELMKAAELALMNYLGGGIANAKDAAHMKDAVKKVLPSLRFPASSLKVADEVASVLQRNVPPSKLAAMKGFLGALETFPGSLIICGCPDGWSKMGTPFTEMPFAARHKVLKAWQFSLLPPFRDLFNAFKRLSCHLYYSSSGLTHEEVISKRNIENSSSNNSSSSDNSAAAVDEKNGGTKETKAAAGGVVVGEEATATAATIVLQRNPNWLYIGYESREDRTQFDKVPNKEKAPPLKTTPITKDNAVLEVDVVIVGSGAGGGVTAGVLAAAGFRVAVLEKGYQYSPEDFATFSEADGMSKLYELEGSQGTENGQISVLSGAAVGGGTVVNWNASFRTPFHVREEWVQRFGLNSFAANGKFDEALDIVCEKGNVNINTSHRNEECPGRDDAMYNLSNELLWRGAKNLGLRPLPVPRNVKSCVDCGHCNHGCAYDAKQGTKQTWLADAEKLGKLTLIEGAAVEKVIIENGVAKGVVAKVTTITTTTTTSSTTANAADKQATTVEQKEVFTLTVNAKAVVVAGGAIHTPAILLRSGLIHKKLGKHLRLHPVSPVVGTFPGQNTELPLGVPMGVYVREPMAGPESDGYGCVIETPPGHPGIVGSAVPFLNALAFRPQMATFQNTASFIAICRDDSSEENCIKLGEGGRPQINYTLTEKDTKVIQHGQEEATWLMVASGASYVVVGNLADKTTAVEANIFKKEGSQGQLHWREMLRSRDLLRRRNRKVDGMIMTSNMLGLSFRGNGGLFSAHQMGTCRLSYTRKDGPLKESGETWEVSKLYVADASTFPTALGINPMVTVQAIAYMIACNICTDLGSKPPTAAQLGLGDGGEVEENLFMVVDEEGEEGGGGEKSKEEGAMAAKMTNKVAAKKSYPEGPTLTGDYGVRLEKLAW